MQPPCQGKSASKLPSLHLTGLVPMRRCLQALGIGRKRRGGKGDIFGSFFRLVWQIETGEYTLILWV